MSIEYLFLFQKISGRHGLFGEAERAAARLDLAARCDPVSGGLAPQRFWFICCCACVGAGFKGSVRQLNWMYLYAILCVYICLNHGISSLHTDQPRLFPHSCFMGMVALPSNSHLTSSWLGWTGLHQGDAMFGIHRSQDSSYGFPADFFACFGQSLQLVWQTWKSLILTNLWPEHVFMFFFGWDLVWNGSWRPHRWGKMVEASMDPWQENIREGSCWCFWRGDHLAWQRSLGENNVLHFFILTR